MRTFENTQLAAEPWSRATQKGAVTGAGRHELLSEHKPAIDKLATQMETLSEARNSFLHALFSAYDGEKNEITLRSLYYAGNEEFHITRRDFGTQKLIGFGVAVNSANQSLAVITSALFYGKCG
jgi:hypothetical protein